MIADTAWLARLIGDDGLQRLVTGWGGLTLRAPKRLPAPGHMPAWLAALDVDAAQRLIDALAGDAFYVPKCDGALRARRDAAIVAAYDGGARVADLAREHNLSERWIWAILGRAVPDGQGSLF